MTRNRKAGHYTGPNPNCARIVARIFLWIKATVIAATIWRGDLAGWHVSHSGSIPTGVFGCWQLGLTESWRDDLGRELIEREQQRQRSQQAKQNRAKADRELRGGCALPSEDGVVDGDTSDGGASVSETKTHCAPWATR
jgi:hypothetical protein